MDIGIIDSGVIESLVRTRSNIVAYRCLRLDGHEANVPVFDECGHGTLVYDILQSANVPANFYIANVTDSCGRTTLSQLFAGLKWIMDIGVSTINISMCIYGTGGAGVLLPLVRQAETDATRMFCSATPTPSVPMWIESEAITVVSDDALLADPATAAETTKRVDLVVRRPFPPVYSTLKRREISVDGSSSFATALATRSAISRGEAEGHILSNPLRIYGREPT